MNDLKIFFVVLGCIIGLGIFFYFSQLYYFFYQDVLKTENSILIHQFLVSTPNAKEDYVSTWGAFGDFVGGTLNPIIGLISVILLFATWFVTYQTLKVSRDELSKSTEALKDNAVTQKEIQKTQKLQQFDSLFFNLLQNFQYLNVSYSQHQQHKELYKEIFIEKKNNKAQDLHLIQYFSLLKLVLVSIHQKLNFIVDDIECSETKNYYIDIISAQIPNGMLHILALSAFRDRSLQSTLENSGFFRDIEFKYYNNNSRYNSELLSHLHRYDEKIFNQSQKFIDMKKTYIYEIFFSNGAYIHNFFQRQYQKQIRLLLDINLRLKKDLKLNFTQDGLEIIDIENFQLRTKIQYNEMIFDEFKVRINVPNSFEIVFPEGQISRMEVNSNTYNVKSIEIM